MFPEIEVILLYICSAIISCIMLLVSYQSLFKFNQLPQSCLCFSRRGKNDPRFNPGILVALSSDFFVFSNLELFIGLWHFDKHRLVTVFSILWSVIAECLLTNGFGACICNRKNTDWCFNMLYQMAHSTDLPLYQWC